MTNNDTYARIVSRVLKLSIVYSIEEVVMNKLYRSLILMLLVFVSLPLLAAETNEEKELGFWVEAQVLSRKQPSRAIIWYEKDITDSLGFFAFVWKESQGYSEYIAGPTWKPIEGLQFGLGVGRETVPEEGLGSRRMFFFEANPNEQWNLHGSFERGRASGPWHKVTATYAFSEKFGAGAMDETLLGRGPQLEFNTKVEGKKTQVWIGLLRGKILDDEGAARKQTTAIFGVNVSF